MKSGRVRSGLVVLQFIISIGLIICTGVVYQQLQFIQNKNLGFEKEQVIIVNQANRLGTNRVAYKNSLAQLPGIISTSYTNTIYPGVNNTTLYKEAVTDQDIIVGQVFVDWDHLETMSLGMDEGRFFDRDFPSDSSVLVVNEALVDQLGWENGVGQRMISFNNDEPVEMEVIGVVKNFSFETLTDAVRPLAIHLTRQTNALYVKYNSSSTEIINTLESEWDKLADTEPFEYIFLDQEYDALFRSEQRLGSLFTVLSALAILISCMGLFGLSAFMAEQRVKEIGIRKVMGASIPLIMGLLSKEFVKLLAIAFVIAVVPSWYFMSKWLEEFTFRIELDWKLFLAAGLVSLIIAWVTVSYQAFKAANSDPVKSLRSE